MSKVLESYHTGTSKFILAGTIVILLIASFVLLFVNNQRIDKQIFWVKHTYEVISHFDRLSTVNKNINYDLVSYSRTDSAYFKNAYKVSAAKGFTIITQLLKLTSDNPSQQKKLQLIQAAYKEKVDSINKIIILLEKTAKLSSGRRFSDQVYSAEQRDIVENLTNEAENAEMLLLQQRNAQIDTFTKAIRTLTAIALFIVMCLVANAVYIYDKERRARKRAAEDSASYRSQFEARLQQLNEANEQIKEFKNIEKFVSTGRIARTIAHEVRNPLTNINLATEQIRGEDLPEDEKEMLLNMIARNSARINQLISDLLNATKFSELSTQKVSLNEIIDEALTRAADRLNLQQVKLIKDYDSEVCKIRVDAEKMTIAFLNIIVNAIEATEHEHGVLRITTRKVEDKCHITFEDNGKGMNEEILNKLFEPFFTNKENGNGLGMTNTQNIILNHKGKIEVKSVEGEGTTFKVVLDL